MNKKSMIGIIVLFVILVCVVVFVFTHIGLNNSNRTNTNNNSTNNSQTSNSSVTSSTDESSSSSSSVDTSSLTKDSLFTTRDLTQEADLTGATNYTVESGKDINITKEGVYVISGTSKGSTIYVEATDEEKVEIVLQSLNITNEDFPCIYVKSGDKVFVTTSKDSSLSVTGTFKSDGDVNTDGVIFSKSDLVLKGTAKLTISSSDNGVVCKDDLKVTGGTYDIKATSKCLDANDSIRIADGTFTLNAGTDALHAENTDDDSLGYVYICGGTLNITASDDGIHGTSIVQIDDGTLNIKAAEGIEGTYIKINGGNITISASDDGINAANKSSAYSPTVEINDGNIKITMGSGDTDGVDSNGDIYINGGTIDVTGNSTFDYDGTAKLNGGTVIVNGTQTTTIPNQMMGGGAPRK